MGAIAVVLAVTWAARDNGRVDRPQDHAAESGDAGVDPAISTAALLGRSSDFPLEDEDTAGPTGEAASPPTDGGPEAAEFLGSASPSDNPKMDPDDPATWPGGGDVEAVSIGERLDPDDPSSWPQADAQDAVSIGEPINPDDPASWLRGGSDERISVGERLDPEAPWTWPASDAGEKISVGERIDPTAGSTPIEQF